LSFKEQETLPFRNPPIMDWDDVEKSENKEVPTRVISLMWNQRSVDTFLGLPFNIASYGLLLEIIAKEVNMIPDEIIGNLGDVHLYLNHIDQAKEQIGRDLTIPERYEIYGKEHSITSIHHMLGVDVRKHTPSHTREPFELPKLKINDDNVKWKQGDCLPYYSPSDFELENYKSHPKIQAPLSN
jgi:thymidylate synthase